MYKGKNIIALCTSRVQDRYHSLFIRELNSRLKSMNCMLLVYNICSDLLWYSNELDWHNSVSRTDLAVFELMRPDITDAVIIMDDRIKGRSVVEKIIKRFNNADVPVGYVCYNFDPDNILEYNRIPNLTSGCKRGEKIVQREEDSCFMYGTRS